MKKFFIYLAAAVTTATLVASCTPTVHTTVLKSYPAVLPDSVVVYSKKYQVPDRAEALGNVSVRDGGVTTQCDSLTVVGYVKLETGKMGGNAALITEHIKPSFWGSTCHQMTATALRVNGLNTLTLDTAALGTLYIKPLRTLPQARFSLNVGYGIRGAKIDPDASTSYKRFLEKQRTGFIWEGSFDYFFSDWYGIALDYAGYYTAVEGIDPVFETASRMNITDVMTYVGLGWAMRYPFGNNKKWLLDATLGLGYFGYTTKAHLPRHRYSQKLNGSTVGFRWNLGVEHRLNENFGLGANFVMLNGMLSKATVSDSDGNKTTVEYEADKREGLGQFRFQVGVRYYIK